MIIEKVSNLYSWLVKHTLFQILPRSLRKKSLADVLSPIIKLLYLGLVLVFLSGAVNTVLEGSLLAGPGVLFIPSRTAQTTTEAVLNFFLLLLGLSGAYLTYRGGSRLGSRGIGSTLLGVGLLLLIISISLILYIVWLKRF